MEDTLPSPRIQESRSRSESLVTARLGELLAIDAEVVNTDNQQQGLSIRRGGMRLAWANEHERRARWLTSDSG
jgi:hypothetical protein